MWVPSGVSTVCGGGGVLVSVTRVEFRPRTHVVPVRVERVDVVLDAASPWRATSIHSSAKFLCLVRWAAIGYVQLQGAMRGAGQLVNFRLPQTIPRQ
jgi:hypothetical protein